LTNISRSYEEKLQALFFRSIELHSDTAYML